MFFILASSNDGGRNWVDDFVYKYDDGASAQSEAKQQNEYSKCRGLGIRYRVRRIVENDGDNFITREQAKNHNFLTTDNLPSWINWPYWQLPHIDPDNKRQIRFFRNVSDAIEERYTSVLMTRYFSSYLDIDDEEFADKLLELGFYDGKHEFKILRDADEIEAAYENGPRSCMNDPEDYALGEIHPSRVYASSDLGLAVLMNGNACIARTVVWPEKKIYARIYGHAKLLREELKKQDYRQSVGWTLWRGAKLLKIFDENEGCYVMPYLDMSDTVSMARDGKHFRIAGPNGAYTSRECSGYAERKLNRFSW